MQLRARGSGAAPDRLAGDQQHVLDTNTGPEEYVSLDLFSLDH